MGSRKAIIAHPVIGVFLFYNHREPGKHTKKNKLVPSSFLVPLTQMHIETKIINFYHSFIALLARKKTLRG